MSRIWRAVYVKSRFEKKVANEFERQGIEHYLPLYERLSQWADRKKTIREPLFAGYIFARINAHERLPVKKVNGVVRLVGDDRSLQAAIPDDQVESLRLVLSQKARFDPYVYLKEGTPIRVARGPLKGAKGKLIRKDKAHRIVISIDLIARAISVDIDAAMVEPL